MQAWMILKPEHVGPYLNSPKVFKNVGLIEDDNPENAIVRSCFIAGSSQIKLIPMCACPPDA